MFTLEDRTHIRTVTESCSYVQYVYTHSGPKPSICVSEYFKIAF